jgi:hypothetical protein
MPDGATQSPRFFQLKIPDEMFHDGGLSVPRFMAKSPEPLQQLGLTPHGVTATRWTNGGIEAYFTSKNFHPDRHVRSENSAGICRPLSQTGICNGKNGGLIHPIHPGWGWYFPPCANDPAKHAVSGVRICRIP